MDTIIALDIGTSKIAAIAFDCASRENIAVASKANTATISGLPDGRHEQCPQIILRQCLKLLQEIEKKSVSSIVVTGQMHGVLLVDKDLNPVSNLITWCDLRAVDLTQNIDRATWAIGRAGCYLHPGYGGATLAMLTKEKLIPAGVKALTIADYVTAKLSGVVATDPSHAASWGIIDITNNCWNMELIEALQIPIDILPTIHPSCSVLGAVTCEMAEATGLSTQTAVCESIGDNQAGYIATCGFEEYSLLINLGTGGQVSFSCENIVVENEMEVRPLFGDRLLMVGASLCGGRSYALLKDFFKTVASDFAKANLDDAQVYEIMNSLALSAVESLEVDTRFAGTRMSPSKSGAIRSITTGNFNPASMSLGFVHGMIDELICMIPANMIKRFTAVKASGNAVRKSPLVRKLISEKLGLECELTSVKEEAATGAAMAAAKQQGML